MQYKKEKSVSDYVIDLVLTAMMTAMVFVATSVIHVNTFNGFVHLGDAMVFVSAVVLGKKKGAVASALGMAMFDLTCAPYWAPFTFVIKGVMAYIAGAIALRRGYKGENIPNNIAAFIIAGIWMVAAYYIAGVFVLYLINHKAGNLGIAFIMSTYDIPGNIAQSVAGVILATPLVGVLLGALKAAHIRK